jgi:hypothetical protein
MSGPIAGTYTLSSALAAAAREVARAATEIAEGYADEHRRRAGLRAQRQAEDEAGHQATLVAKRMLAEELARAESHWRRLTTARDLLTAQMGVPAAALPPVAAETAPAARLEALRAQIEALNTEVSHLAAHAQAVPAAELATLVAAAPNLARNRHAEHRFRRFW